MRLRVERIEHAADKVLFLTLVDPDGATLPRGTPALTWNCTSVDASAAVLVVWRPG